MLAKKIRDYRGAILFLTLALFVFGCTPPGPRALLKGKKLLESGDYAAAVEQFQTATTLLPAKAWNYLGVACQRAGQSTDAVDAYQRALALDRDLMEAHFNLGLLWLEQKKFDSAKMEFTAYTLRRGNEPEGWLKLGLAQMYSGDIALAEKSYGTAYYLNTNNPEGLNGLGMISYQRGRMREAAQFFTTAIRRRPDYADAIYNLATVAQQGLHDNKLALENYRAYLALTPPHQKNWDAVSAIVANLEPSAPVAVVTPPQNPTPVVTPTPQPAVVTTKPPAVVVVHPVTPPPKPQPVVRTNTNPPPHPTPPPVQVVKVPPPEPVIVTPPRNVEPPENFVESGVTPLPPPDSNPPRNVTPLLPTPAPQPPAPAPVPPTPVEIKPFHLVQPAPPTFPRYLYLSPRKPNPGDRVAASGAFTGARQFEQDSRLPEAMEWYRVATQSDPSWFEAQYNYGVLAYRLRNYSASLAAYEMALAIQPDSLDARYNFALALKAAGYAVDAVNEMEKVAAANPEEGRAQLALGNLYAQQLHNMERAREHYLKVLELDPHNSQANDIRFWLSANPP
jgi:tetratricopeptide (TPR) repeat protein